MHGEEKRWEKGKGEEKEDEELGKKEEGEEVKFYFAVWHIETGNFINSVSYNDRKTGMKSTQSEEGKNNNPEEENNNPGEERNNPGEGDSLRVKAYTYQGQQRGQHQRGHPQ